MLDKLMKSQVKLVVQEYQFHYSQCRQRNCDCMGKKKHEQDAIQQLIITYL